MLDDNIMLDDNLLVNDETTPTADYNLDLCAEIIDAENIDGAAPAFAVLDTAEGWSLSKNQAMVCVSLLDLQAAQWKKASAGRRVAAGLIDRLVPLPFLIPFFWPWALVVIAYDLGRDASGASVGKRLMGLRTVIVPLDLVLDGQPCTLRRSLLRNLLWAGARLCYLTAMLVPLGLALDVAGCLMATFTAEGRHLGDRIGGTQVMAATSGKGGKA